MFDQTALYPNTPGALLPPSPTAAAPKSGAAPPTMPPALPPGAPPPPPPPAASGPAPLDYSQYKGMSSYDMLTRVFPGGLPQGWDWGQWAQATGQQDPRTVDMQGNPYTAASDALWNNVGGYHPGANPAVTTPAPPPQAPPHAPPPTPTAGAPKMPPSLPGATAPGGVHAKSGPPGTTVAGTPPAPAPGAGAPVTPGANGAFGSLGNLYQYLSGNGPTEAQLSSMPEWLRSQFTQETSVDEGGATTTKWVLGEGNPWSGVKDQSGNIVIQVGDPSNLRGGDGGVKDPSKVTYDPTLGYVTTPDNITDTGIGGVNYGMLAAVIGAGLAGTALGVGDAAAGGAVDAAGTGAAYDLSGGGLLNSGLTGEGALGAGTLDGGSLAGYDISGGGLPNSALGGPAGGALSPDPWAGAGYDPSGGGLPNPALSGPGSTLPPPAVPGAGTPGAGAGTPAAGPGTPPPPLPTTPPGSGLSSLLGPLARVLGPPIISSVLKPGGSTPGTPSLPGAPGAPGSGTPGTNNASDALGQSLIDNKPLEDAARRALLNNGKPTDDQLSAINAGIAQERKNGREAILQASINSGQGGGDSMVVQDKLRAFDTQLETQRQQLVQQQAATNTKTALDELGYISRETLAYAELQLKENEDLQKLYSGLFEAISGLLTGPAGKSLGDMLSGLFKGSSVTIPDTGDPGSGDPSGGFPTDANGNLQFDP